MKILVCIAQVPDTTAKVAFTEGDTKFDKNGVTMIINPYDEWYALVRALELKEEGAATEVHLITVGDQTTEATMRKALALGGDQAFRINTTTEDSFNIAANIAAFAQANDYQLILTGKESIDYNNAAIGGMIAGLLDRTYVGFATKLDINGNEATIAREIDGGTETDTINLPAVISCQKGMAEARIPNMKGIMSARTKPLTVSEPTNNETLTEIVKYELPPAKSGVKMFTIDQMDELVAALHNEAKVL